MSIDQAAASAPVHPAARAGTGRAATGHPAKAGQPGADQASSFENLLNALSAGSDDAEGSDPVVALAVAAPAGVPEAPADLLPGMAPPAANETGGGVPPMPWLAALEAMQRPGESSVPALPAQPIAAPDAAIGPTPATVADPAPVATPARANRIRISESVEGSAAPAGALVASQSMPTAGRGASEASKPGMDGAPGDVQSRLPVSSAVRHAVPRAGDSPQVPAGRADLREAPLQAAPASVAQAAMVGADPTLVSWVRPSRELERRESTPGHGQTGPGLDGGPAVQGGGLTSYALTAPDAPVAVGAASGSVAEKLFYWVTGGVQNAELQVDAFGGGAVEVSVSVQGNEALVEFRSDQPEARRVLQDAMPQLRSMLREEGLMLSGGFVGTSARDGADASPRRRPDAAQGLVSLTKTPTEPVREVTGPTAAGGRLDVFV